MAPIQSFATVLVAGLLLLTAPVQAGAAISASDAADDAAVDGLTSDSNATQAASPTPNTTVRISHSSDQPLEVRFELRYSIPENVSELSVSVPTKGEVIEREGFERSSYWRYSWTKEGHTASITFVTNVTEYQRTGDWPPGSEVAGTTDWILTEAPNVDTYWRTGSSRASRSPLQDRERDGVSLRDPDEVAIGERLLFVGPYDEFRTNASGQSFRLIRSHAAELNDDPDAILNSLSRAARRLHVGARDASVLMFAAPDPIQNGGYAYRDEFVVSNRNSLFTGPSLESANNVWIHEYVHTRQSLSTTPEMSWFTEASAEYYAALLTFQQENVDSDAALKHLRPDSKYCTEPLARPGLRLDEEKRVEYRKGSAVLYVLDQRIRNATNYRRSLMDVFRRMNSEMFVNLTDFKSIVADVAGRSMDAWIDRYVDGKACPSLEEGEISLLSSDGRIHDVSVRERTGGDDDGNNGSVTLSVRADTTLEDPYGDGDPRFTVTAGNYTFRTIENLEWGTNVTRSIRLEQSELSWYESDSSTVNVSVELWEDDVIADDDVDRVTVPVTTGASDRSGRSCDHSITTPSVRVGHATDRDSDGHCTNLTVDIRFDRDLADSHDFGISEPEAVVEVDGRAITRTSLSVHGESYRSTVALSETDLHGVNRGKRTVSVTLWDADFFIDDRIASWNVSVSAENSTQDTPANST